MIATQELVVPKSMPIMSLRADAAAWNAARHAGTPADSRTGSCAGKNKEEAEVKGGGRGRVTADARAEARRRAAPAGAQRRRTHAAAAQTQRQCRARLLAQPAAAMPQAHAPHARQRRVAATPPHTNNALAGQARIAAS
jgi:hypothetical protein